MRGFTRTNLFEELEAEFIDARETDEAED